MSVKRIILSINLLDLLFNVMMEILSVMMVAQTLVLKKMDMTAN